MQKVKWKKKRSGCELSEGKNKLKAFILQFLDSGNYMYSYFNKILSFTIKKWKSSIKTKRYNFLIFQLLLCAVSHNDTVE